MGHIRETLTARVLEIAQGLEEYRKKNSMENSPVYECEICKDLGYIYYPERNSAKPCKCLELKQNRKILEHCGITDAFKKKTFENYDAINSKIEKLKNIAIKYVQDFDENSQRCKSIGFFGQSGVGKTHLTIAIANTLMSRNIAVRYMPYIEKITELKNLNRSSDTLDDFKKMMNVYKNARVLMIDDLFKSAETYSGEINQNDVRIMVDIINHRYLKGLPTIFSSELTPFDLANIDEALGGRIVEMCGENIAIINKDIKLNYRFRGVV